MQASAILQLANSAELTDEEVVTRVLNGETALFEILMRRYNQRLYRVARSILRDDGEAEDVMQDAYVRAYQHLGQFAGRAKFSTWLTRIAVHEALARAHRGKRYDALEGLSAVQGEAMKFASAAPSPEQEVATAQSHAILEEAILSLPESYRTVLMMRDIEELTTAEAAESLDITEQNVKVRLHRARALLRRELYTRAGVSGADAFAFMGVRCDRVVKNVFARLAMIQVAVDPGSSSIH
ncbi:MAG: RNA polymerase sigma factor [Acidobacteria bacterium]|nr:MAG: RNA polymerase sigma factor [Acidobacteriota bacterium]